MIRGVFRLAPLALFLAWAVPAPSRADEQPAQDPNIHVQARGQIHEAFAQPAENQTKPMAVIPKKPPEPIPEEPPSEKPAGDRVHWIPGYWQWDDDRKDFTWISGCWRNFPESRHWVVGHWGQEADGYVWVSGHWAADQEPDLQYVPKPPEPKAEEQPKAPDDSSFYIPGTWFYTENGYQWRDGYWADHRDGYIWQPARYIWTPGGYVFSSGYWDYDPYRRGLLFAPVYFDQPLWGRPGWVYRPFFAINLGLTWSSWFIRPGYGHYYFGDYYGAGYGRLGFQPWYSYNGGGRYYDPLFGYQRWAYRNNPTWYPNLRSTFDARANGTAAPPPRVLAARTSGTGTTAAAAQSPVVPLSHFHNNANANVRLETVSPAQHTEFRNAAQNMHRSSVEMSRGNFQQPNITTSGRLAPNTGIPLNQGNMQQFHPGNAQFHPGFQGVPQPVQNMPQPSNNGGRKRPR